MNMQINPGARRGDWRHQSAAAAEPPDWAGCVNIHEPRRGARGGGSENKKAALLPPLPPLAWGRGAEGGADWLGARRPLAGRAPVRRKEVEAADWPGSPSPRPPWRPARPGGRGRAAPVSRPSRQCGGCCRQRGRLRGPPPSWAASAACRRPRASASPFLPGRPPAICYPHRAGPLRRPASPRQVRPARPSGPCRLLSPRL